MLSAVSLALSCNPATFARAKKDALRQTAAASAVAVDRLEEVIDNPVELPRTPLGFMQYKKIERKAQVAS
jgi:hypothetical protein